MGEVVGSEHAEKVGGNSNRQQKEFEGKAIKQHNKQENHDRYEGSLKIYILQWKEGRQA